MVWGSHTNIKFGSAVAIMNQSICHHCHRLWDGMDENSYFGESNVELRKKPLESRTLRSDHACDSRTIGKSTTYLSSIVIGKATVETTERPDFKS